MPRGRKFFGRGRGGGCGGEPPPVLVPMVLRLAPMPAGLAALFGSPSQLALTREPLPKSWTAKPLLSWIVFCSTMQFVHVWLTCTPMALP